MLRYMRQQSYHCLTLTVSEGTLVLANCTAERLTIQHQTLEPSRAAKVLTASSHGPAVTSVTGRTQPSRQDRL
jgi:hypothetical protein